MIGPTDLERIVRRIVSRYDPDRIYLFGSYARGEATSRSDLDFIVVKRTTTPPHLRGRDVHALMSDIAVAADVIFVTPEELETERTAPLSFANQMIPSARLLYERSVR